MMSSGLPPGRGAEALPWTAPIRGGLTTQGGDGALDDPEEAGLLGCGPQGLVVAGGMVCSAFFALI